MNMIISMSVPANSQARTHVEVFFLETEDIIQLVWYLLFSDEQVPTCSWSTDKSLAAKSTGPKVPATRLLFGSNFKKKSTWISSPSTFQRTPFLYTHWRPPFVDANVFVWWTFRIKYIISCFLHYMSLKMVNMV